MTKSSYSIVIVVVHEINTPPPDRSQRTVCRLLSFEVKIAAIQHPFTFDLVSHSRDKQSAEIVFVHYSINTSRDVHPSTHGTKFLNKIIHSSPKDIGNTKVSLPRNF